MKFKPRDATMWVFCWASTPSMPRRDYPTSMVNFSRRDLIREVGQQFNEPWKRTYRQGGRAVKCLFVPQK